MPPKGLTQRPNNRDISVCDRELPTRVGLDHEDNAKEKEEEKELEEEVIIVMMMMMMMMMLASCLDVCLTTTQRLVNDRTDVSADPWDLV